MVSDDGLSGERTRQRVPDATIEYTAVGLLMHTTPLLEEEGHLGINTLVTDTAYPIRIDILVQHYRVRFLQRLLGSYSAFGVLSVSCTISSLPLFLNTLRKSVRSFRRIITGFSQLEARPKSTACLSLKDGSFEAYSLPI